ncbi:MAG: hypothetical protein KF912_00545 [Phycisphaeraceae bacterium]|nr:hypothetical protein [Phycisphaeraceae bacterium]MBX3365787.1 hypothetical protein [Phycisphaeraceae bacterium]
MALTISALGTNVNDWALGEFTGSSYFTTVTAAHSAIDAVSLQATTAQVRTNRRAVLGGDDLATELGNSVELAFYGRVVGTESGPHASARVWGIRRLTRPDASKWFVGQILGDISITLGATKGAFLVGDAVEYNLGCDLKIVAPDRSLTPPGMRVTGQDSQRGLASVLFDGKGYRQFVIELRCLTGKSDRMGVMTCML